MKRSLTTKALLAGLAFVPMASLPAAGVTAQSVVRPSSEIVLSIGKGDLVNVPGSMTDVFIADDSVADVQIKSQRQLYVFGKSGGETTVYASDARGDIIWSATVRVGSNIGSIDQMLALAMPEAKISVATMGTNTVLLTGTVAAPEDAAEAQTLVEAFVGEETNVISRLKMATPLQVNLRVRFAEVSKNFVRALGANLLTEDTTSGFQFGVARDSGSVQFDGEGGATFTNSGSGATIAGFGNFLGLDIIGALDLAERQGLVTTLSQPNLTALSGETAEFLAGGEFPIPLSQGLGTTTVEYKNFGVSLAYAPTVLSNGRISIRVRPEVSELSTQGSVVLDGFTIPALTVRRAETTVELGSGQSFMIAGLMSTNSQSSLDKAPGLGDVPILGNLFRSTEFRRGETELVIVVTPYLVKPVDDRDIRLPTDGYRAPNEAQRVFGYFDNDGVTGGARPGPTTSEGANATPQVSQSAPSDGETAQAQPEARRNERTADNAAPGFSFE